jgi:hypothetical protein
MNKNQCDSCDSTNTRSTVIDNVLRPYYKVLCLDCFHKFEILLTPEDIISFNGDIGLKAVKIIKMAKSGFRFILYKLLFISLLVAFSYGLLGQNLSLSFILGLVVILIVSDLIVFVFKDVFKPKR